jgi:uncharacterized RDD family membrane protein YckC
MEDKTVSERSAPRSDQEEWDEEELEAAGLGSRLINYLFDVLGIVLFSMAIGTLLGSLGQEKLLLDELNRNLIGCGTIIFYYVFWEGITGRTPGKLVTGTYVVTDEGLKPSFATILGRTLCRLIPLEAFSFILGSIGFHDRLSHTRVVKLNRQG